MTAFRDVMAQEQNRKILEEAKLAEEAKAKEEAEAEAEVKEALKGTRKRKTCMFVATDELVDYLTAQKARGYSLSGLVARILRDHMVQDPEWKGGAEK